MHFIFFVLSNNTLNGQGMKKKRVIAGLLVFIYLVFFHLVSGEAYEVKKYKKILWEHLETLCGFGPRNTGSPGYQKARDYIKEGGLKFADDVLEQEFVFQRASGSSVRMFNIEMVFRGKEEGRPVLVGAHYDTRPYADEEPDVALHAQPILGANDGGSGTAVLLGLAQYLHEHRPNKTIKLVFFDGEDFGAKFSAEMFVGSTFYARQLEGVDKKLWPYCVLIVDMVGDKDLEIFKENNSIDSAPWLLDLVLGSAKKQKIPQFRENSKYTVMDDHTPFIRLGIPSAVLIDFDYPHWHKLSDTLDKCSPASLLAAFSVVAGTLEEI
jgi:Zn-dependent M28 family amino/carboxypeptidase